MMEKDLLLMIEELKDDYRRRIISCDKLISEYTDEIDRTRVKTKKSCYLTFISELNKLTIN